ncbi:MAG: hypothetical protein JEZ04_07305 [Spirochaetales bacterium]|nr:hypothetical protein [Spirochaetales bacterium]
MKYCNCSFSCGKKGVCCECIAHHRAQGQLPACYFPDEAESSGDRSIENFIKVYKERGSGFLR